MHTLVLVVDNIRSTHNVGSLLRTCDGLGIAEVYLCGITPYPLIKGADTRLPHISAKLTKDIHKTALGAEETVVWHYCATTNEALHILKKSGYIILALEQSNTSVALDTYTLQQKSALIVGPEVTGMSADVLSLADVIVEIPMHGHKESLNVSVAAGIALYSLSR